MKTKIHDLIMFFLQCKCLGRLTYTGKWGVYGAWFLWRRENVRFELTEPVEGLLVF